MSAFPCSVHGRKVDGRMASIYSAWFLANGERTAWKQRVCVDCVRSHLAPLLAHASEDSPDAVACPACGSDASEDLDPIYLTVYPPKQERREYALTTCAPCAVTLRLRLQERAERLPNRNGFNGTSKDTDEPDDWAGVLA